LFVVLWTLYYIWGLRRVRLHTSKGHRKKRDDASGRLSRIVSACPSLSAIYWPPWFAPGPYMQVALLGLKELRARLLQRSPYSRQLLTLRDGTQIALDWVLPGGAAADQKLPVCVLLHGAFMDSTSATMRDLARHLADAGFPTVVMNRRGYGGMSISADEPGLAMFGLDEDLDEVLAAVGAREPGRPVAIVGFSCGSGFAGRYCGKREMLSVWSSPESQRGTLAPEVKRAGFPRILCGVAYDPGYNVSPDGAPSKVRPPASWVVGLGMRYFYVFRHRKELRSKSPSFNNLVGTLLSPRHGIVKTYRLQRRLCGANDSSDFLQKQQPLVEEVEMPCLLINSRDDPVCVWENVVEHMPDIMSNPNLVLAELARGSHGCKFDFWGRKNVAHDMIKEFVAASWHVWKEPQRRHADGDDPAHP